MLEGLSSRAVIGKFYERLQVSAGLSWVPALSMHIDSDMPIETYAWLGMAPAMREWIGGRLAKELRANGLTITNKTFEATLELSVDDMRRDKTGQVLIRIGEMADRVMTHKASLLSTLLVNGGTGVCYDGHFFFDTVHADPGAQNQVAQVNDITFSVGGYGAGGSIAAPTSRTMQAAILAGIAQIMGFKDDVGEPMNELATSFLAMVPINYMQYALAATTLPILDAGAASLLAGNSKTNLSVSSTTNARLTQVDRILVFRTDADAKPLIEQEELPVQMSALAEGSEQEFKNNMHQYGVKRIGNVGYGLWQRACRVQLVA